MTTPFPDTTQHQPNPDAYRVAIVASERLRNALARHCLTLPSLRGTSPTITGVPLVELGGCAAAVVEQIAAILESVEPGQAIR